MKLRRATTAVLVAGGVATVTLLVGLVSNVASSQQNWPGWLRPIQHHPWQSLGILALAAVALTALLEVIPERQSMPHPSKPTVPPASPSPASGVLVRKALPRDSTAFINRREELRALVETITSSSANRQIMPVHVINGMAGVGKTTFAIHVGHLIAKHFPDGQLFVNLSGHTPGRRPVEPGDALASLLAATGVAPQQIPTGVDPWAVTEARAAMWRSELAGRRMLVILDNATNHSQIEPLLPGEGGCLVLVTSRRRLATIEGVALQMEALSPHDAATLFVRLSGRELASLSPSAVEHLATLCGYLPLALSLLAAQLRHHPSWTVENLENRLIAAQDRLDEMRAGDRAVAAAFDLSYNDLSVDHQRFFRLLGAHPGQDIYVNTAAAISMTTVREARRSLESLYDDHLLNESTDSCYRFHDLVRQYCHALAMGDPSIHQNEVMDRLSNYYLTVLGLANERISRPGEATSLTPPANFNFETPVLRTREQALDWLEEERANVLACIEEADALGQHSTVIQVTAALAPFLRHAGPWDKAAQLHHRSAELAQQIGDKHAQGNALTNRGVVLRFIGTYALAREALTDALRVFRELDENREQANALHQLGVVLILMANYQLAINAEMEALALYQGIGDVLGQANTLNELGIIYRRTGRYREAIDAQTEALAVYRQLGDRYGQANALGGLGIGYGLTGQRTQALERLSEALEIERELGDRTHEGFDLNEIGVLLRMAGDLQGAKENHSKALAIFSEIGDQHGRATSIRYSGIIHRLKGYYAEAIDAQKEALAIYRDISSRDGEAATLNELGVTRGLAHEKNSAIALFQESLQIFHDLGDPFGEAEVLNNWGFLLIHSGEWIAGLEKCRNALRIARGIETSPQMARALHGIGMATARNRQRDEAVSALREALELYRGLGFSEATEVARELASLRARPGD